jgi:hypothetical protein
MVVASDFCPQMLKLTYCITRGFSAKDTLASDDGKEPRPSAQVPASGRVQ